MTQCWKTRGCGRGHDITPIRPDWGGPYAFNTAPDVERLRASISSPPISSASYNPLPSHWQLHPRSCLLSTSKDEKTFNGSNTVMLWWLGRDDLCFRWLQSRAWVSGCGWWMDGGGCLQTRWGNYTVICTQCLGSQAKVLFIHSEHLNFIKTTVVWNWTSLPKKFYSWWLKFCQEMNKIWKKYTYISSTCISSV